MLCDRIVVVPVRVPVVSVVDFAAGLYSGHAQCSRLISRPERNGHDSVVGSETKVQTLLRSLG